MVTREKVMSIIIPRKSIQTTDIKQVPSDLLAKVVDLECPICTEIMIVPVTTKCRHSFCYRCMYRWCKLHRSCPTCRYSIKRQPQLNVAIKDVVRLAVDSLVETNCREYNSAELIKLRNHMLDEYNSDVANGQLYGNLFERRQFFKSHYYG
ncbi:uncharacterized protein SPAPADRAFT_61890 [Spathaspora passalidarum NRRL Y-27907]|uniref:RING-type domain-containing protein n=1 Tax=Spathaspora passalidarum (strain NRRL Y-27907 / 11-Y1) TaxID=619300 RepID=G3ARK2_SPAPN|nr:uncharacterized protein SPAPADRAFT_61890 [Spathaspora passalidarum NRRL Y-27907]EGW31323.1 hypothetical protein SPAPADRAFT_61890 [Spathaspora passalidarum NRRL Y-27907]